MKTKRTNRNYLEAVHERIIIFDGAMGTNLQTLNLTAEHFGGEGFVGCNDFLVISYPSVVENIHRSFLEVGVDVIQTNTFRANSITLSEYGLHQRCIEINKTAATLARQLADEYSASGLPRFVAGSIGPSGKLPSANDPQLSNIEFDELAEVFREQASGLIQGGVDVILIETSQDILELKATVAGIHQAFRETGEMLPIQAQFTLDTTGRMLLGTDVAAALTILDRLPIDIIGLNCSTGPEHMRQPIQYLGKQASIPVSCIPNAGLPVNIDGEAFYPLEPDAFAHSLEDFIEQYNVRIVGGCCGTTPVHLEKLVQRIKPDTQRYFQISTPAHESSPRLSSSVKAVTMKQEPPPLLIGERCNAQGSRKFKSLLLENDIDGILTLARQQVDRGAHALDISVAVTENPDEIAMMKHVVKQLSMGVDVPLVIDTTEPEVMEAALKIAPGRCLLNSTHLESGPKKAKHVFALAKAYNAAVLCLTIDEEGMARSADQKLTIATRLFDIAVNQHGLRPEDLVFDPLTFTLSTGDPTFADSARQTLDGIRMIKEQMPGVMTSLGVSNVSFGLKPIARHVLNSVMLYRAVQAGLDMAIVNPAQITPYPDIPKRERQLSEDLLFNKRPDALEHFITYYEGMDQNSRASDTYQNPTVTMSPKERLHWRILHRQKEGVEADIDELINISTLSTQHEAAVYILNEVLLPSMKDVGDKFGAGELILPFVLQSAEVMNKAVAYIEQFLDRIEGTRKGVIVLATVYGDVHDIGKNLVKTILSNNGYEVVDLGKQVPAETIISKAVEVNADAIGLSALLVSTSKQMPLIVNELQRRDLNIPVLLGGAAINRRFARRALITDDGKPYKPGVFYCKDAFEGLVALDTLKEPSKRETLYEQVQSEALREITRDSNSKQSKKVRSSSPIHHNENIPKPPFWGPRVVTEMPLEEIFQHLDERALFRLSWGAKNTQGEDWLRLETEFKDRLTNMRRATRTAGWLKPQGVYGYWPAQSEGDNLIVYSPASIKENKLVEIVRFEFPRQSAGERLCLADYFVEVGSERLDVVAFQVVTVGWEASTRYDQLHSAGDYAEAYFFHGLAVQTAEAAAEFLHNFIQKELVISKDQGKRYSWGYPAIPDLEDHRKVFDLLPAEEGLAMTLTEAYQLVPEQSTAAIIVHNPEAKYFSLGPRS